MVSWQPTRGRLSGNAGISLGFDRSCPTGSTKPRLRGTEERTEGVVGPRGR